MFFLSPAPILVLILQALNQFLHSPCSGAGNILDRGWGEGKTESAKIGNAKQTSIRWNWRVFLSRKTSVLHKKRSSPDFGAFSCPKHCSRHRSQGGGKSRPGGGQNISRGGSCLPCLPTSRAYVSMPHLAELILLHFTYSRPLLLHHYTHYNFFAKKLLKDVFQSHASFVYFNHLISWKRNCVNHEQKKIAPKQQLLYEKNVCFKLIFSLILMTS